MKSRKILTVVALAALLSCMALCGYGCNKEETPQEPVQYTITYDVAGGNTLPSDARVSYTLSGIAIALPTPTRIGYDFLGWNNGSENITEIAAGTTGNLSLTAVWRIKTYTLTFNYNGGSGTETSRNVEYGELINELPNPTVSPAGKTFDCWKTTDGSPFANDTKYNFDKDMTIIANYTTNTYVITYNVAGGDTLPADSVSSYEISETAIALPTPTKTGYDFLGWNNGLENITEIAAGMTGNLSLTAVWQIKIYTITFDYNGGSGAETTRSIEYGALVGDLPEGVHPVGKSFEGWKTEGGDLFVKGVEYNFDKNITLTADWRDVFTVILQNDTKASFTKWADGTTGAKTVLVNVEGVLDIPPMAYDSFSAIAKSNNDYAFRGWYYKDKDGVEHKLDLSTKFTFENLNVSSYRITVYAKVYRQWTKNY